MRRVARAAERRRQAGPGDGVVLTYHRIAILESDRWRLAVTPRHFAEHIAVIAERFRPRSLRDLAASLSDRAVPPRSVVVTFDDGYRDNLLTARPLLERYDVPATVFVVTGYTGSSDGFWWDELERLSRHDRSSRAALDASWRRLRELPHHERLAELEGMRRQAGLGPAPAALAEDELTALADGGLVEVGAHTATHPRLPGLSREAQLRELTSSRHFLEERLGHPITSFSYPHGEYDRTTVECVRAAGFQRACAGGQRAVTQRTPLLEIPRVQVDDVPGDELARLLESRLRG